MPQFEFVQEADEEIDAINEANFKKRHVFDGTKRTIGRSEHWASDALKPCMREAVLKFTNYPETNPLTQYTYNIFGEGKAIEGDIIDRIKTSDKFYPYGGSISLDEFPSLAIPIKGRLDVLMKDTHGAIVPCEIKTLKEFGDSTSDSLWMKYIPRGANIAQLMCYIRFLNTDYGYLWYFNKNRPFEKMYKVNWDEDFWQEKVVPFYSDLEQWVLRGEIPEIADDIKKHGGIRFPCQVVSRAGKVLSQCQFYDYCWPKEEEEE